MKNCGIATQHGDIATEQERSLTITTRPRPHAARKLSWSVLLRFRQEDVSQNLVETNLSTWL